MFSATWGEIARGQQDLPLAAVIARGVAGFPLGADDLAAGLLPLADQLQNLTIEFVDPAAQVFERAHENTL
jgi:hypothetical protein